MADGLSIKLEGGANLDRILSRMQQRVGTKIINQSLTKGAAEVRKDLRKAAPKNTGQLRKSIKSGLRKKVNLGRHITLAGVWFNNQRHGNAKAGVDDGWYVPMVIKRHKANAFGYKGGNDFLSPSVRKSNSRVRKIIGVQLRDKIAKEKQKELNKLK